MQAAHVRYPFWGQVRARWTRMSRRSSIVLSLEYSTGGRVASMFAGICQRLARRRTGTFSMPTAGTFSVPIDTPRLSLARSSTVGMSSSSVGSPQPGVLLPFRGWDWCVTGDPAASDSAEPPQNAQNRRESGLPSVGGAWAWTARHRVGQGPTHGRILKPVPVTAKLPAGDPPRITSAGSSATTGLRVGAPRRPTLPWRAVNAGVRGGAAPRQPPQGTHGVWPHGVSGTSEAQITAGDRVSSIRTARSATPALGLDSAGPYRESGKNGLNGGNPEGAKRHLPARSAGDCHWESRRSDAHPRPVGRAIIGLVAGCQLDAHDSLELMGRLFASSTSSIAGIAFSAILSSPLT